MSEKHNIFIIGRRYRVKQDFNDGIYTFTIGEILVFKTWGFIPYDSSYGYQFHSESDPPNAKDKLWTIYAGNPPESPEKWRDYFEPIN